MLQVDETNSFIQKIREFSQYHIKPYANEFEKNKAVPRELIKKMAEIGLLGATIPKEFDGLGLLPLLYGRITEEIGKACCSTRSLLTVHCSLVAEVLVRWGSQQQKQTWLPQMACGEVLGAFAMTEPDVGSDARNVKTAYRQCGKGYVLNGVKKWITFGDIANIFIVIANNEDQISAFLVERDFQGVATQALDGLLASKAAHIAQIELNEVFVPKENVIGGIGGGFSFVAATALDHGRYSIAWASVAIAQAALEAMVAYSSVREQFGKKLCEHQLIQAMIADATTDVHAARAVCLRAAQLREQRDNAKATIETTVAKYFSSKVALRVASDCVQVHGGNGCCNQYPAERLFREAKVMEIIEGSSQIQQMIISKYALNAYTTQ